MSQTPLNLIMDLKIGQGVFSIKTKKTGYIHAHTIVDGEMMYEMYNSDQTVLTIKSTFENTTLVINKSAEEEPVNNKFMLGELVCIVRTVYKRERLQFVGTIGIISKVFMGDGETVDYNITTEDGEMICDIWEEELETYVGPFRNPYKKTSTVNPEKKRRIEKIADSSDDNE